MTKVVNSIRGELPEWTDALAGYGDGYYGDVDYASENDGDPDTEGYGFGMYGTLSDVATADGSGGHVTVNITDFDLTDIDVAPVDPLFSLALQVEVDL